MKLSSLRASFDDPISRREDDHLLRWNFAREIFHIATKSPSDWSVRIGIYGKWGSGKTSVLKFLEQMATKEAHFVVWFNPWQYGSKDEMWLGFFNAIQENLSASGVSVPHGRRKKFKAITSKLAEVAAKVSKVHPTAESIASVGLPFISQYLRFGSKDLGKLPEVLGEKRLIIMIDDLDRTDYRLVPQFLYSLRELLNLSHFIFILAFDPQIVGKALHEYHSGWGSGLEFLEKMIDFPKWLPPPTKETLLALAEADIRRYCPFVDFQSMRQVFDFLPDNPRTLRTFIRYLWNLQPEVKRHNPNELNWDILILVNLLKASSPDFVQRVFDSKEVIEKLLAVSFIERDNKEKKDELKSDLEKVCDEVGIKDDVEKKRLVDIAIAIGSHSRLFDDQELKYNAFLTEQPAAVTWKEYEEFYKLWRSDPKIEAVKKWIKKHASARQDLPNRVFIELFEASVQFRLTHLQKAADSLMLEELKDSAAEAENVLTLLEMLSFDLGGFVNDPPILNSKHFKQILDMVQKWVHFMNDEAYRKMRAKEKEFLFRIAKGSAVDPAALLECLSPWRSSPGFGLGADEFKMIRDELISIIAPRVANHLIQKLRTGEIETMITQKPKRSAEIYVLFRMDGPMWRGRSRKEFLEISQTAPAEHIVQRNLIEFILMLSDEVKQKTVFAETDQLQALLNDQEILDAAWTGALANPLNPRMFGSFIEVRRILEKAAGRSLKVPSWWERMQKDRLEGKEDSK